MIDEKKLIEELKMEYECCDESSDFSCGVKRGLSEALTIVKYQPKVGEWIPVEERLPEDLMTVNVTWVNRKPQTYYSYIKDKPFVNTALRFNGKWYWWSVVIEDILREYGESVMDEIDNGIEVLAWQPLPEPYEVKDNG